MAYRPNPSELVGRDGELEALTAQLDEASAGHGAITLVSGVPGIGKSHLASALSQVATRRSMTTLWGRCFEGEATRQFAPWVEALLGHVRTVERGRLEDQLGEHAASMAQLIPPVRRKLGDLPEPPRVGPDDGRLRLFAAVTHFVLAAAQERPILLVLDDLQWADPSSLALLRHLARHLARSAVAVVGTYREDEVIAGHPLAELVPMLRREAACQHVRLGALSLAESTEMAALVLERGSAHRTPAAVDASLAAALVNRTSGNPFYIQATVKDVVDAGQLVRRMDRWVAVSAPETWDVPREVRDVIERRLARLPKPARHLVRAACACTDGFTFEHAQALTDADEESLLESIDVAMRAELLRVAEPATLPPRYDFAHALVRQALYTALNPDRRARLHLRTAQALERGPVTDELAVALATHYRLAGRLAAPERSIGYSVRAGDLAQASFAYEDAVEHWRRALDLMAAHAVAPERRAALLERLGTLLFFTAPDDERGPAAWEQAVALYQQAGQHVAAARSQVELGARLGASMSGSQDLPRALRHLRAAESMLPPEAPSALRAFLYMQLGIVYHYRLLLTEALACTQQAFEIAREQHDELTQVQVSIQHGWTLAGSGSVDAGQALLIDAYERAGRLDQPHTFLATALASKGYYDLLDPVESRRWLERQLAGPGSARAATQSRVLTFRIACAQLMMGARTELPLDLPPESWFQFTLTAQMAYADGDWYGCRAGAEALLNAALRRGNRWLEFVAMHQLGRLALAERDMVEAEDVLGRALALVAGQHRPSEALVASDLAVLHANLGRTEEARAALRQCRSILSARQDWRGLAGRVELASAALAAAEGRSDVAQPHLREAVTIFRRYRLPWDEAQALECWGTMLIKAADFETAKRRFDAAAAVYRRHRVGRRWLERLADIRADARLGQTARTRQGRHAALSHREIEVLRLVAIGQSNREIAEALVLSVRTVEQHLAHLYDKLGVSGKPARAVAAAYGIANGLVASPEPS